MAPTTAAALTVAPRWSRQPNIERATDGRETNLTNIARIVRFQCLVLRSVVGAETLTARTARRTEPLQVSRTWYVLDRCAARSGLLNQAFRVARWSGAVSQSLLVFAEGQVQLTRSRGRAGGDHDQGGFGAGSRVVPDQGRHPTPAGAAVAGMNSRTRSARYRVLVSR